MEYWDTGCDYSSGNQLLNSRLISFLLEYIDNQADNPNPNHEPHCKNGSRKPLVQTIKDDENELRKMGMQVLETGNYD